MPECPPNADLCRHARRVMDAVDVRGLVRGAADDVAHFLSSGVSVEVWAPDPCFARVPAGVLYRACVSLSQHAVQRMGPGGALRWSVLHRLEEAGEETGNSRRVDVVVEDDGAAISGDEWRGVWLVALEAGGRTGLAAELGVDSLRRCGATWSAGTGPRGTTFAMTLPAVASGSA